MNQNTPSKQDITQVAQAHNSNNVKSYYCTKNSNWVRQNLIEYKALQGRSDPVPNSQLLGPILLVEKQIEKKGDISPT